MIKLAPSLLAADFARLEKDVKNIEFAGADYLHLDVMDGLFVPNLSFGEPVISSLRKISNLVFDTHLMIVDPIRYVKMFANCGSQIITFHFEACDNHKEVIDAIHALGVKAGMSIKPKTDPRVFKPFLQDLDLVLVMTVEPGYGGQKLIPETVEKISACRKLIDDAQSHAELEADGGINTNNLPLLKEAGVDVVVAGSAVFRAEDPAAIVRLFKA
ncbi:MAG TPA: ribulose-phosphate 3-epimerase [Clostridiales bacterium]|jgi:ribulose-phosphate 3-epimerase|nr:ribulose-phosphate 3-epimerase [Clostridiales bacterium]HBE14266.1 ribulose-phosphate 3-epimerase [Clostridiales bacterium]HCG35765.1 ribulose-phosphate 3-epimerase [Clostridiales bacterium]